MQRATVTQKLEPEAKEKVANPEQAKGSAEGKEDVPVNTRAKPQRDPYEGDVESHVYGCNPTHAVVIDHKWFIGLHRHFQTNAAKASAAAGERTARSRTPATHERTAERPFAAALLSDHVISFLALPSPAQSSCCAH
jgi:hypothetical protein